MCIDLKNINAKYLYHRNNINIINNINVIIYNYFASKIKCYFVKTKCSLYIYVRYIIEIYS